ncbi:hypothetical protein ABTP42_19560, partial [Acinetobacter baumannii]
ADLTNIATLVRGWLDESYDAAKASVYNVSSAGLPQISTDASAYSMTASQLREVAHPRILAGGKRLASILNAIFGVS